MAAVTALRLFAAFLVSGCYWLPSLNAQQFEARGKLVSKSYDLAGLKLISETHRQFTTVVSSNRFWSEPTVIRAANSNIFECITSSDGHENFTLSKRQGPVQMALFGAGVRPRHSDPAGTLTWLALGSFHYLNSSDERPALTFDGEEEQYSPTEMNYLIVRSAAPPRLPAHVRAVATNYFKVGRWERPTLIPIQPRLLWEYEVLNWTNLANLVLPQRFIFRRYGEYGTYPTNHPAPLVATIEGVVEALSTDVSARDWIPQAKGPVIARDFRFANDLGGGFVEYMATNQFWRPTHDPVLLEIVNAAKRKYALETRQMAQAPTKRIGALLTMIVALSVPILCVLYRRSRTQ